MNSHSSALALPHPTQNDDLRSATWYRTATRWTQITFVEDDPHRADPEFWIDIMKRSQSNAVCISAGGYMAFYPTQIPFHYRSTFLRDADLFGELVNGARRLGMHVMARVDPHAIHADAAAAHPEWLERDVSGAPVPHWAFPDTWVTSPFGPYNSEFITGVVRELVGTYDIDAVFMNRWQGDGVSYTAGVRERFRTEMGLDLPVPGQDPASEEALAWKAWRKQRLSELVALWDTAAKDVRPHTSVIPNLGSLSIHELDRGLIGKHYPLFFIDRQGRDGVEPLWSPGRNAKRTRGVFPDRPVGLITSVGPESHQHRWKDSVNSPAETAMWIVAGFAQGAFPWFTKFNGKVPDDRWIAPVTDAFGLHARLEPSLAGKTIHAQVAVIDPGHPFGAQFPGEHAERHHDDGFYHALVEARIPFELVAQQEISTERIAGFDVVVLPSIVGLLPEHQAVLEEYVAGGGALVGAFESGLAHDTDAGRSDLGPLFGISRAAMRDGLVKNNYIELQRPADPDPFDLTGGFDGAQRVIGGTRIVDIEAEPGADVPFRFIPDFPDLPMEEVYPREDADRPAVVTTQNDAGGRTVYFSFNVGAIFWEALQPDHGRLIRNAIFWALDGPPEVTGSGAGVVEIAVYRGEEELTVCVVNLTNPMAMKGPLREIIPLEGQTLSVAIPAGRSATSVRSEVSGRQLAFDVDAGRLRIELPAIEMMEAVCVSWGTADAGAAGRTS
ncbi:family 10 glycosylhydrolase [Microbacterium sp. MAHUQ-60]|uniref:family 10 glycosylhydrolase n=1 Tax=unclassified Microbacterium TaxID=2609290 RepID=UPI00360DC312